MSFNPLHCKISMHILHIVLEAFLKMQTWRICLAIKSFIEGDQFLYSPDPNV